MGALLMGMGEDKSEGKPGSSDKPVYSSLDLKTLKTRSFDLPGTPLLVSPDLKKIICLNLRLNGDQVFQSITVVDVDTLTSRVLLDESLFPARSLTKKRSSLKMSQIPDIRKSDESRERWRDNSVTRSCYNLSDILTEVEMVVSDDWTRGVWLRHTTLAGRVSSEIDGIDMATGARTVWVGPEALPSQDLLTKEQSREGADPSVTLGFFTSDGKGVVYRLGDRSYFVCDGSGQASRLIAELPKEKTSQSSKPGMEIVTRVGNQIFAPSGRRVAWSMSDREMEVRKSDLYDVGTRLSTSLYVGDGAKAEKIYESKETPESVFWLDEERVVVVEPHVVRLLQADGRGSKILLSSPLGKSVEGI